MGKSKDIYHPTLRNNARKLLLNHVIYVLGRERNGLKLNAAIQLFADTYKLKIEGNKFEWLLKLYVSNENDYIKRGLKPVFVKSLKNSKDKKVKHLFNKPYKTFLKSSYWKEVRLTVLKRDNNTCVCGNTKYLQVRHKTYKNHFKEHENLQDLITLCRDCHKKEHDIK